MRKNVWKKAVSLALATLTAGSIVACGERRDSGEKIDNTKTQIYVALYNGGLGYEWMNKIKEGFEAKYPEYQIIINKGKANYDAGMIRDNFNSYPEDLFLIDYMGAGDIFNEWITKGYAADISDIVINEKLTEYGESVSIYDKMNDSLKAFYGANGKCYSLPWYQASYQTIYDKALFKEMELYKDEDGEWNDGSAKHLGIDGVASFDDGLPRTVSEFKELVEYMRGNDCGLTPYTFYGTGDYYFNSYLSSVYADYEGYNDFMLNATYNGTDSDLGEITLENGYLLSNGQEGKRFALELAKYVASNTNNYTANTFSSSQDNIVAQRDYLLSTEDSKVRTVAMLVEGAWWETEAKQVFSDMASRYRNPNYAYGKREFGVMPIPKADDGSSAEGRTICCSSGTSMQIVNGKKNATQIANAKKLLKYMHSNEGLAIAVAYTNVSVPYEVELTTEQKAMMTPYARELQEVYETSTVVYDGIPACDFLRYEGSSFYGYNSLFATSGKYNPAVLMSFLPNQNVSVDAYLAAMAKSQADYEIALNNYNKRVNE